MEPAVLRPEADVTFDQVFAREYPRVVAIAQRVVRDHAAAEDVAQEVFASFARSGPSEAARAAGWLHTAAVHAALNHLRTRRRSSLREVTDFRLRLALRNDRAQDPQHIVPAEQERARMREAMLRLTPRDAEILVLRYSGLRYRDIAMALDIDATHVGVRLARAERALRREIET